MAISEIRTFEQSSMGRGALYVVWKSECHRSTMTARAFEMPVAYIAPIRSRSAAAKVLRYLLSCFQTAWVLLRRRPAMVMLLNQPLPMVLIVWAYTRLAGARFMLDCHSAPFSWRAGLPRRLYDAATRAAAANLNHNRKDQASVEAVGGRSFLVPEIPLEIQRDPASTLPAVKRPNAIAVCSFMADEPIELFLEAARRLPACTFYLTGDWRKRAADVDGAPSNVVLLGFLSREDYLAYLVASDVIITLSDRPHIMQMAAEEALGLGRPLITNHSPILEEVFGEAALFVPLKAQPLADAVEQAHAQNASLTQAIVARRGERAAMLAQTIGQIIKALA